MSESEGYTRILRNPNKGARILCPFCQREGEKSRVYEGACYQAAVHVVGYYDEDGQYQEPGEAPVTCAYTCSRGHAFKLPR
jgi:hypothetical protein